MAKKHPPRSREPLPPLRQRAEKLLPTSGAEIAKMATEDIHTLVYELQVHQIELELQNQELREAQLKLAEARDRYADLYEFAPLGYLTLDVKGRIMETNLTAATMLGVERTELVGAALFCFVARESQDDCYFHLQAAFDSDVKQICELAAHREDGTPFVVRLETIAQQWRTAEKRYCLTALIDVTEIWRAQRELRQLNEELDQRVHVRTVDLRRRTDQLAQQAAELERREREFRTLANNVPALFAYLDHEQRYCYVNHRYQEFFQQPPSEIIGKTLAELLGPKQFELVRPHVETVLSGEEVTYEAEFKSADEQRTMHVNYVPDRDQQRHVQGFFALLTDITEQKRAEQNLRDMEQLQLLADSMPALIAYVDTEQRYQLVNRAYPETFGRVQADLVGQPVSEVLPEATYRIAEPHIEAALRGEPQDFETELKVGGREIINQVRYVPRFDQKGAVAGFYVLAVDVTRLKLAETALMKADRRKDEFLAMLGHELRNPLAPLRTSLEVMRLAKDPTTVAKSCAIMERQVAQLTRLVDDLLDVSRISRGKLELKKTCIELAEVVRSAVETTQPLLDEADHELSVVLPSEPLLLDADPHRLAQVFDNLLSNAAKYTPAGGHIELRGEPSAGGVRVSVRDDGSGIPLEKIEQIFEKFAQLDRSLEGGYRGLGVGLSLVKSLVELHGGTIDARSEGPGKGSEFVIWLPVLAETEPSPPRTDSEVAPRPGQGTRHRVLVVEDYGDAARALARLVEMLGHEVWVAFDGLEAVAAAAAFRPHVVLLDIELPELHGHEVARRIRAQPRGKEIVLVAITGWGQECDRKRAIGAGFDHHLIKPLDPSTLQAVLEAVPAHEPVLPPPQSLLAQSHNIES